jgi:hypothetical protein
MRCYTDYRGMAQAEAEREAGIDVYRDYADILAARQAGAGPDPLALWGADGRGGRAQYGARRGRAQLACRGRPRARLPAGDLSRG